MDETLRPHARERAATRDAGGLADSVATTRSIPQWADRMKALMDTSFDPRELIRIGWRRKWYFIIPAAVVFTAAIVTIFVLPPLYRSQATILIEPQEIPENVVPSLVTEQIDRRLQIITQRVLVSENLLRIADRHNLFADERDTLSRDAIAGKMRERIETDSVVTQFNDQQSGRSGQATLVFEVSFSDPDPKLAHQVTSDLVSIYLSNNAESRRTITEQTTNFLAEERTAVDRRIATIEDELTTFKTEHRELLPDEAAFKRQLLNNLEQRLRTLESDLRALRERESYLSTQLALTDEFESFRGGRETPESRLELLRAELASARARYSSGHPDVVRLQREVQSLQQAVGARAGSSALAEEESRLTTELSILRERYTDQHPDVERVRRALASVRQEITDAGNRDVSTAGVSRNSAFIQLSAQLNSVQAEIKAIDEQRGQLRAERIALQEDLARAPEVEREYNRVVRRLENALADREELADKETAARLSGSLEATAARERLALLNPPSLPGSPSSPNKKLILAIGFVLAVGSGGTLALVMEFLDRSIRSVGALTSIVGDPPLAVVPLITTGADARRKWLWRLGSAAAVVIIAAAALAWVHERIAPLDVLGYQAMDRAERWVGGVVPPLAGKGSSVSEAP
jgi:polysaccharide biosynthesis transport protein